MISASKLLCEDCLLQMYCDGTVAENCSAHNALICQGNITRCMVGFLLTPGLDKCELCKEGICNGFGTQSSCNDVVFAAKCNGTVERCVIGYKIS